MWLQGARGNTRWLRFLFYDAPSFLVCYAKHAAGALQRCSFFRELDYAALIQYRSAASSSHSVCPRAQFSTASDFVLWEREKLWASYHYLSHIWTGFGAWVLFEAEWLDQHASLSTEQCVSNLGFMFVDCLPLLVIVYLVRYNQQQLLFSMNILFSRSWLAPRILVHTHCQSLATVLSRFL